MLYTAVTSMLTTVGTASCNTNLRTGVSVILVYCRALSFMIGSVSSKIDQSEKDPTEAERTGAQLRFAIIHSTLHR